MKGEPLDGSFVCWDVDNEDEPGLDVPAKHLVREALSVEGAAEAFAERIWAGSDYATEWNINVRDPGGWMHDVKVTVEMAPVFHAKVLTP